jgi:hypothetical protein
MDNLLKLINEEKDSFETKDIQLVPGLLFNQKQTIEQIYFYYNSKFQSGEIDEDGDKKYFYNIVKNPCKIFSKAIDFDTKNIRLLTSGGGNPLKTWFMERDLKYWMEKQQFGKVLNRIFWELPIFGSVVLKIINGKPYFVDLRNFIVEQSADCLDDANYIIEKHPYTVMGFRKAAKDMGWDKSVVDETIKQFRQTPGSKHIMVYERYGEVADKDGNWTYRRVYIADVGVDETDEQTGRIVSIRGVELSSVEVDSHPYWEFHLEKIPGRWLGVGVVETLFEPQIHENERENLQSKSAYWRAIVLFKSQDTGIAGKNLLTENKNGDVLDTSSGDINQLNVQEQNLPYFNDSHNRWMKNRDELTFSYDVVQGERLPAGTPLGSAQIAISQTLSYFETIQETIAMDVKEMIYEVILPQFEKDSSQEHTLRLVGKDLDAYTEMIKDELTQEEIVKAWIKKPITVEEAKVIGIAVENGIKKNGELLKDLPKNFYKGLKYDIMIDITGESVDTRVRNATKFAILQAIQADPMMLQDPTKKKILFSIAEDGGINLNDFIMQETKTPEEQMTELQGQKMGGGGISAPKMTAGAMPGTSQTTI